MLIIDGTGNQAAMAALKISPFRGEYVGGLSQHVILKDSNRLPKDPRRSHL
jgi:hypothetical protein